jgi:ParB family chromosome partitioning protein
MDLPLDEVHPREDQPRRNFDAQKLEKLTESVRLHGVIQPIVVEADAAGYRIVAGERRWRAARAAGLDTIPAVLRQAPGSTTLELSLVENLQRADLDPIEEGLALKALIEAQGLTQEAAGSRVGRSREAVANALRLLELPEAVRRALVEGRLTPGHGRALAQARDPELIIRLAREVEKRGLSVRQTEELARRGREETERKSLLAVDPGDPVDLEVRALERRLSEHLGLSVSIARSRRRGTLTIEFTHDDQLEALLSLLLGDSGL